ncbi:hypothetical protein [Paraoerskovia marina]|uniref:hypothetical protein n=1 Tax=Paraoerskovia marina TaxID=545619 RepID=UPI00049259E9|nr:hypothetical protein [Paraoerskovia marina]
MAQNTARPDTILGGVEWDPIENWYVWHASETSTVTDALRAAAPTDAAGETLVRAVVDVDHQLSLIPHTVAGAVWVPDPTTGSVGIYGHLSILPVDGRHPRAPKQYRRGLMKRPKVGPDGMRVTSRRASVFPQGDEYTYVHLLEAQVEPERNTVWSTITSTLFMENTMGVIEISTRTPHTALAEQYPFIHSELNNSLIPVVGHPA